jgi:hypothetical protein
MCWNVREPRVIESSRESRRRFLAGLAGIAVAPLLSAPAPAETPKFGILDSFRHIPSDERFYAFIHPDCERDLRQMAAKDDWQYAYRQWRLAGKPDVALRDMIAKYPPVIEGQDGVWRGMKININTAK